MFLLLSLYFTFILACPGFTMEMTPAPLLHIILQSLVKQGFPFIKIDGFVGIHIPAAIGIHGCGVNTPKAAAVAAATCGLAIDVHIPNGPTFTIA